MVSSPEMKGDSWIRALLGLGFWIQGLRGMPWMAVTYFLKDGLKVDPSKIQLLQNSANLPMVAKPLYGILSDAVYIKGQHRIPYIAIGGIFLLPFCYNCLLRLFPSLYLFELEKIW